MIRRKTMESDYYYYFCDGDMGYSNVGNENKVSNKKMKNG
jgi:hypothetical protein